MELKCLVVFCVILVGANAAAVAKRDIPVEVLYENNAKNLEEKVQEKEFPVKGVKNLQERIQLSPEELEETLNNVPGVKSAQKQDKLSAIKTAEEIIYTGLDSIKKSIDKAAESLKPSEEAWRSLNKTIENFLEEQRNVDLKDDNQQPPSNQGNQFFQIIANGFQQIANNFAQGIQNNQSPVNGSEDEQTGQPANGFFQNFVSQFQGGVQQVVNNINNIGGGGGATTSNTVLGDTGTDSTPRPPGFFNNVVTSVQQFFGQSNQGVQSNNNQSDTGTGGGSPQNFFQGAINQINQAVNNFRPTSSPPAGSEDTPSSPNPPQNFIQSSIQTIQSLNPFGQGGSQGSNPISSGAQAIGSQVQQAINNQQAGVNPVEGIQNAISSGSNPVEGIQNAISGGSSPAPAPVSEAPEKIAEASPPKIEEISTEKAAEEKKPGKLEIIQLAG